jgi:hypothetical protein
MSDVIGGGYVRLALQEKRAGAVTRYGLDANASMTRSNPKVPEQRNRPQAVKPTFAGEA